MGQMKLSTPLAVALIAVVVVLSGFALYKGVTGGTVGDGHEGRVMAAPPMPETAKQQMRSQAIHPGQSGAITP
jgi:hypothetical protein